MCVYPSFRTRPPRCLWRSDLETSNTNGSDWNTRRLALCPSPHTLAAPKNRDATANVRCYDHPAKEVLVKVLRYLLARLGICLVWAVVEVLTNWSLDTVDTKPLTQTARART